MKKIKLILLSVILLAAGIDVMSQGVAINKTGNQPDSSAMLDISSDSLGLLIPRLTESQREDNIQNPANGLVVYDPCMGAFFYYNGTEWLMMGAETLQLWDLKDVTLGNYGSLYIGNDILEYYEQGFGNLFFYGGGEFNLLGDYNTTTGFNAMSSNRNGDCNSAFGYRSLRTNLDGNYNTAIGNSAGENNGNNSGNVFLGCYSGYNADGDSNVFIGIASGYDETGSHKLYIENSASSTPLIYGDFENDTVRIFGTFDINNAYVFPTTDGTNGQILQTNGNGILNWVNNASLSALQWSDTLNQLATDFDVSLKQNVSDTSTVDATRYWVEQQNYFSSIAINDLTDGKTGQTSVFLGSGAGSGDNGSDTSENVGVGMGALNANVLGVENTAIGHRSLYNNTGNANTASGFKSLYNNTSGGSNNAFGYQALHENTSGGSNIAIGYKPLLNNTIGSSNIAIGYKALHENDTASGNIGIGYYANRYNQYGSKNTIIGYEAGRGTSLHSKTGNVFLGYQAGYNETGDSTLYIENGPGSDPLIYGDFANDTVRINGTFDINSAYVFPTSDGTNAQVLQTDGNGVLSWTNQTECTITGSGTATRVAFWNGNTELSSNSNLYWENTNSRLGLGTDVPGQQLDLTGSIELPLTTDSSSGVIYKGTQPFIHNFKPATNDGYNTFVGVEAGNLAMGHPTNSWYSSYNTAMGNYALHSNSDGYDNTAVGNSALSSNNTGYKNSAYGTNALNSNTTGAFNTAIGGSVLKNNKEGYYNAVLGFEAGQGQTDHSVSNNTILGYQAGYNVDGDSNVFIGNRAGYHETGNQKLYIDNSDISNPLIYGDFENDTVRIYGTLDINNEYIFPKTDGTAGQVLKTNGNDTLSWSSDVGAICIDDLSDGKTGGYSVFLGDGAGANDNGNDNYNTATGCDALHDNTSGTDNSAFGLNSLYNNENGEYNTSIGRSSLYHNTSGNSNVAVGIRSLYKNTTQSNLVAIGDSALFNNGNGATQWYQATKNTALGSKALFSNTTGHGNSATGDHSLYSNTNGYCNTANGYEALYSNTGGDENTAFGYQALYNNLNSQYNTAVGNKALHDNVSGQGNSALGALALYKNIDGMLNTANGMRSMYANTDGDYNTAIGYGSLQWNESGNYNTIIGFASGQGSEDENISENVMLGAYAGYNAQGNGNTLIGYKAGYYEYGSNKLYIENSSSTIPLIYGEFDNNLLRINGTLDINNEYIFPTTDGTADQVLATNGNDTLSWTTLTAGTITAVGSMTSGAAFAGTSADDQWLGLGAAAGRIEFDNATPNEVNILGANVGIGTVAPSSLLEVYDGTLSITNMAETADEDAIKIGIDEEHAASIKLFDDDDEATQHFKMTFDADSEDLRFHSDQKDNILYLTNGGYVGIGIANPGSYLDINGNGSNTYLHIDVGAENVYSSGIRFKEDGNGRWNIMYKNWENNNLHIYDDENNRYAMTFQSNTGNIGISNTDPQTKLHILGGSDASFSGGGFAIFGSVTSTNIIIDNNEIMARNNGDSSNLYLNHDGGYVHIGTGSPTATLSVNGTANKPGGGSWAVFSDARSKENVKNYHKGLSELLQLRPVSFNYKEKFGWGNDTYIGLIAQEVEKVVPTMVSEIEVNDMIDFKELDPNEITYMLINAVKEQQKQIEELQRQIEKLQSPGN